jgi:hypothetical protein
MIVRARSNVRKAITKLRNMNRQVRRSATEVLESEGRICAISLAKSSQPFGTGGDAKDMGERAVARDIAKVYVTVADVFAKLPMTGEGDASQFWKLVRAGKYDAAQDVISKTGSVFRGIPIGQFDDGDLHRRARTSRGRVTQNQPSLIVTNQSRLVSYARSKISLVGFGKSAWASIARQLGGIRGLRGPKLPGGERDITANWITRKSGPGTVHRQYGTAHPRLTLTSRVRYADQILSSSAYRNAIRIARDRIVKQIAMAARYEMRHPD